MNRKAWRATVHGVDRVGHSLETQQQILAKSDDYANNSHSVTASQQDDTST